jgi:flavodoxin I
MKTLVVYDSLFGNTEQIARSIAAACSAFGPAQAMRVDATRMSELEGVDVLVVGCPTQGFRATPALRAFLDRIPGAVLRQLHVACFDTRIHMPWPLNGAAAPGMARQLHRRGVVPIVPPEGFFVLGREGPLADGELERAARWAEQIHERCGAPAML